jgi:hypothetical protein
MGMYINQTSNGPVGASFRDKCDALIEDGATPINPPEEFQENLVCVVNNVMFAAAAYAYSESEMIEFKRNDGRNKQWFIYDKAKEFAQ